VGAGCGSGPSPRKADLSAGGIPETWFPRCSVLRIRDAVQWWCLPGPLKPSLAKQLPPGTTIAPLTLQRNRHGSKSPPGPFYEAGVLWELALQAKGWP